MRWLPVAFLTNGVYIVVTRVGFELTTPVLRVRTLNYTAATIASTVSTKFLDVEQFEDLQKSGFFSCWPGACRLF